MRSLSILSLTGYHLDPAILKNLNESDGTKEAIPIPIISLMAGRGNPNTAVGLLLCLFPLPTRHCCCLFYTLSNTDAIEMPPMG